METKDLLRQLKDLLGEDSLEMPLFGCSPWHSVWVRLSDLKKCLLRLDQFFDGLTLEHLSFAPLNEDTQVLSYFLVQKSTALTLIIRAEVNKDQKVDSLQQQWGYAAFMEQDITLQSGLQFHVEEKKEALL